jgi:hypothetical protein
MSEEHTDNLKKARARPARPRFRMAKSPRRVPTWRSERHASSAVGERATVRSPRQERVIESYSVMARLALAGSACIGADHLRAFRESLARWRQELSRTIAQCLNLEHEIQHNASKPCILGFEPLA